MIDMIYNSNFRNLVVGADTLVPLRNGKKVTSINFDNAATTPPFFSVLNEIINFSPWYASINRGKGYKSQLSSELYENSRKIILDFINGNPDHDTVIYVKNSTEGINKLANRLCNKNKKCVILSTGMEHHSNDLPWRDKFKVDYIKVDDCGRLCMEDLKEKLIRYEGSVELVSISGASNVTGYKNPIHSIAKLVHKHKAKILVDGAQLIPHSPFDMKAIDSPEHIDYLVFSAHKMYAPFGIGVLIGPKSTFEKGSPDYVGGGTVQLVTHQFVSWNDPPGKEEAGTPNVMGVIALIASINTLKQLGMGNIELYEKTLTEYALHRLKSMDSIQLYGNILNCNDRVGIIPFNVRGIPHSKVAEILSYEAGISVRTGCFCAQPYIQKLLKISSKEIKKYAKNPKAQRPGMIRISFGLYNTFEEIDILIDILNKIIGSKSYYCEKYN